jgi:hypothetical protein
MFKGILYSYTNICGEGGVISFLSSLLMTLGLRDANSDMELMSYKGFCNFLLYSFTDSFYL